MRMIPAILFAVASAMLSANGALAQSTDAAAPADTTETADTAPAPDETLSAEELEQLVAPIALYPDQLLADVLMASTYPLEIIEADRWVKKNKSLKGDALAAAVGKEDWEESVKSLAATPSVLDMMSEQLEWTQKLGDAVLAQQADIMDAVQALRLKAQEAGQLKTTTEQIVTVTPPPPAPAATTTAAPAPAPAPTIVIEPAEPETVYVPYYDPTVVYGGWSYPSYPPYYWPPAPGYYAGAAIATGIAFGAGVAWVGAVTGGFDWNNGDIDIDINRNVNKNNIKIDKDFKAGKWQHDPKHRGGVRYNNASVDKKFSKGNVGSADKRMDFRGKSGNQVIKVGDVNVGKGAGANVKGGDIKAGDFKGGKGADIKAGDFKAGGTNAKAGDIKEGGNAGANVKGKGGGKVSPPKKTGGGAFDGIDKGGASAKAYSDRGKQSVKSFNSKGRRCSEGQGACQDQGAPKGQGQGRRRWRWPQLQRRRRWWRSWRRRPRRRTPLACPARRNEDAHESAPAPSAQAHAAPCSLRSRRRPALHIGGGGPAPLPLARGGDRGADRGGAWRRHGQAPRHSRPRRARHHRVRAIRSPTTRSARSSWPPTTPSTRSRPTAPFKATLVIGDKDWPFPIPITKKKGMWRFNTPAGRQEILYRRVGQNEADAIEVALAYVDAQKEYAADDPDKTGVHPYAERIVSSPDKKDGLYWPSQPGEKESPIGEFMADASSQGYTPGAGAPYHGYRYKILTRQGPAAPGGAYDYIVQRQDDRRLRPRRLPGRLRQFRRDDLHRQPGRRGLPEGPRTAAPRRSPRGSTASIPTRPGRPRRPCRRPRPAAIERRIPLAFVQQPTSPWRGASPKGEPRREDNWYWSGGCTGRAATP